ncbi:MAG: nitroreductase family protein [Bacteroidaceae bacterium]|nr:nitroreductase family protein [Bacteroidaceae bacterium]
MEQFSELARKRRSHRKFSGEKVSDDHLQVLLDAALMAPTSKGLHSYSFCVVENQELLASLAGCKAMGSQFVAEAQCAIVVLADPETSDVWIEDASTAAMSILYQAEDLGLGACWVQVRERKDAEGRDSEDVVREILSLPANKRVVCFVALGHKGMDRKGQNMERIEALKQEKVTRFR